MGQKIWRRWCHSPCTAIFQNSGGGEERGGGVLGGVAYKDRARPPLRGYRATRKTPLDHTT